MPVCTAIVQDGLPTLTWSYPVWDFAPRRGTPAQAYGEPYPTLGWILARLHDLCGYRYLKQYPQADAIRQWLCDYGMTVEYEATGQIRVRY